jgi:hypothetical protein
MNRPICEEMVSRPSDTQEGWSQWGVLSIDGQDFTPLYPLETNLPTPSALYFLAAAGICDIQGQPRAGQLMPDDGPAPTVDGLGTGQQTEQPAETPTPIPHDELMEAGTPGWVWVVGLALIGVIGGAAFSRARREQTDTTPPPDTGYRFNQGGNDGR